MADVLADEVSIILTDIFEIGIERLRHIIYPYVTGKQGAQYRLLHYLTRVPMESMTNLGKAMYIPKQHMTTLVDSLITEGYVERHFDPADRRVIYIKITETGRTKLREFRVQIHGQLAKYIEKYEPEDLKLLASSLQTIKDFSKKY
ncbi:MarR family winged helix-turn-helix transcriptional regulator [Methanospirillum lacunae]|uniref:HTH marR-type domain-containing protein n=1 Tax=Methanospirillum lacunae TaxID=668570 RepID=A0A2V2N4B0_9EURY|nr:MarR family transcriptional regulator [Methanospirillum lacunae]PWR72586.1 hypothetical protein DK846_06365 [Methanospirillum lacunae]